MEKCIIVAIADNNAIGKDNALLWHISEDLKFFKRTTMGCPVIMGRKTFESISRPLPKRLNIVISRGGFNAPEGVEVTSSLEEAYTLAERRHPSVMPASPSAASGYPSTMPSPSDIMSLSPAITSSEAGTSPAPRAFVIGGGQIYAQAMSMADCLIVTHVHTIIEDADTFFPPIDPDVWKVVDRSETLHDEESGYDFEFVEYRRF